jgi:arabinose-5-phosphate isomerase
MPRRARRSVQAPAQRLRRGRRPDELRRVSEILHAEASAIAALGDHLGPAVVAAADFLGEARGRIVATGIGKTGFVAQKFSATLAATGIPSFFLHAAEAMHGDLGRVAEGDVVVAFSNSGATQELVALVRPLARLGARLMAVCGDAGSPLAQAAERVLAIGATVEACPVGLVPTVSAAALLAASDALAMTLAERRGFGAEDFARYHPAGKLGRSVLKVGELMRRGRANPLVHEATTVAEAVVTMTNTPGRPGAASVVDAAGRLIGIFTDGDLRRLVQRGTFEPRARVGSVMTRSPASTGPDELVKAAEARMREAHVDQLPVVDERGVAVGLLDVQDILSARV